MLKAELGVYQWVRLPSETRLRLAEMFHLKRSGGCDVQDGRLVSDGFTQRDLEGINLESLQAVTGSESKDFFKLIDEVLAKIEEERLALLREKQERLEAITLEKQQELQEQAAKALAGVTAIVEAVKRPGRPKKL